MRRGDGRAEAYRVGVLHCLLGEWRINDEVAVVCNHRPRLLYRHAQDGFGGTHSMYVLQHFRIGERDNFDRDALRELTSRRVSDELERTRSECVRLSPGLWSFCGNRQQSPSCPFE